jgi:uroporphyrinogen-III synthase
LPAADATPPLAGVRIVITRAREQSRELMQCLEQLGAQVLSLPAISFAEPDDPAPLDSAIASLANFDWLIFTSTNAVKFFAARCHQHGSDPHSLQRGTGSLKIAVVGPATAQAATEAGFAVDYAAEGYRGEALARELGSQLRGTRVLLPRSDRAMRELPQALESAGAKVTQMIAYKTLNATDDADSTNACAAIQSGAVDAVAFFSPSAFRSIIARFGPRLLERTAIAAIGPTTAAAIRDAGLPVTIEARESSTEGFITALVEYFGSKASQGART